jgi:hypothetical protein
MHTRRNYRATLISLVVLALVVVFSAWGTARASLPAEDAPLAFFGKVVDSGGEPIADAEVIASSWHLDEDEPYIADSWAETDSQGRYEFRLPPGDYIISARTPRHKASSTPELHFDGTTAVQKDFVLKNVPSTYLGIKVSPTSLSNYGDSTKIAGRLRVGSSTGAVLPNQQVRVQKYTSSGWRTVKTLTTSATGYVSWTTAPRSKTKYRLRYRGQDSEYGPAKSAAVTVSPKAYLSAPSAARYGVRAYKLKSYLKPRHKAGSYPVRMYRWKYVGGKWVSYGYVRAKAYDYSTYSKVKVKHRFPSKGKWRIKAIHPEDSRHLKSKSSYTYLTVR